MRRPHRPTGAEDGVAGGANGNSAHAVARGFGVYGEGPIEDPKDLGPALKRAIAMVKRGEPALIDVVTDPR